jgi:hypothetical protein
MKDLRTRRGDDLAVDLDGPDGWSRGAAWEGERPLHPVAHDVDQASSSVRPR